jgi:ABC-type multidrug transport system fused ATPase/permease subunit
VGHKKQFFRLFNQNLFLAIFFLIIQQLIVASSTIWITRLIADIQTGFFSYQWLGLYLSSLLLPYLPGAAALIEVTKAKAKANIHFVLKFADVYKGQILEWTHSSHHSTKASVLTSEAPQTINSYLDYWYHFASCGLNVVFNLLILAIIIEPLLFISYGIGFLLAFALLILQKKRKKTLSLRAQQSRIQWVSMLLRAWDNILLNNVYNFNLWGEKTNQRGKRFESSTTRLEIFSQGISIALAFLLLGPTFAFICYFPMMVEFDLTKLAIMVVALPRLFQVLSYSYELLFVLADLPMQKSRLSTVLRLLETSDLIESDKAPQEFKKRIDWNKIQVRSNGTSVSLDSFQNSLESNGRYTVYGENGSGKSSLLLLLKMKNGSEAFYLPAKHDLVFQGSKNKQSTGQYVRKILHELLESVTAPIILLDEWDANLDLSNQGRLSELIDTLSKTKCVVEVRHRIEQL